LINELNAKINVLNQTYQKLDLENSQPTEETIKRASELLRAIEDYKEKLKNVLTFLFRLFAWNIKLLKC
jgi:hypothetical protein